MLYVIRALDKPDSLDLRMATRPKHLEYNQHFLAQMKIGGPLLDAAGDKPVGSLLILDFADRAAAEAYVAGDPYTEAGLFHSVEITPYRATLP